METLKARLASHGKSSSPIKASAGCGQGLSNRTMILFVVEATERLVATRCKVKVLSEEGEGGRL